MLEKLIEEMIEDCTICHEGFIYNSKDYEFDGEPVECNSCDGTGKELSYEGEKLRHLILHGKLP